MSDEQRKNLLVRNTERHYPYYAYEDGWLDGRSVTADGRSWATTTGYDFSCELAPGTYVLTAECDGPDTFLNEHVCIHNARGDESVARFPGGAGAAQPVIFSVTGETAGTWYVIGKRRGARWRAALFAGTEPAAWAPYSGEDIAGGGALMSANLLAEGDRRISNDGTTYADGVWSIPANGTSREKNAAADWPTGTEAVTENQTLHIGLSVRAASGASVVIVPGVAYVDGAGNLNSAATPVRVSASGTWQRVERSLVMPSGMRVSFFFVHQGAGGAALELTAPCLSYGSPVCLASSAHTPYATQDHVSVTYATKASLKVTDDSIKTEVSARAQTDRNVADLSSRLTQTANSLTSEISDRRSAITTVTGLANAAQSTADSASEQTVELSSRLDQTATDITATIESKVQTVQQGVDGNASDVKDLNDRLSDEIRTRKSFMRFSEESSDPTLTLGQTDSPAQVKLTNKQLQFLYLNTVVAYMSGDALLINNAKILQQLQLGGFAFVPRDNGNLAFKWVGGDS